MPERRHGKFVEMEDRIFSERRIGFYGTAVAIAYVLAFVWRFFHGQWIFLSNGSLRCTDFGWMWLSGKFAASDKATQIFDHVAFSAAQIALFGRDGCAFFTPFVYPPTFLFFTYPLGWMTYLIAFAVWIFVTLFLYEAAVYAIIPRRAALIAAIASYAAAVNIDFAHNGFITAALFGFSLLLVQRRPWLSGIFLGLLTYKPHMGVLFPLALLATRNWRALASAAAASAILGVGAAIAFGFEGWQSFLHTLFDRQSTLSPDAAVPLALHSIFGLLRWLETSATISWGGHLVVAVLIAVTVCVVWAKPCPFPLKAAVLCIGSAMVSPYILFYDLCVLSIAVAFLVRDGVLHGFLPGERTAMLICTIALFFVQVPVGPVVCITLLFFTVRRILLYRRLDPSPVRAAPNNFEIKAMAGD
jgi:hypothetical protein